MSDIPSHLSKWEPPRLVKIGFVAFAAAAVLALFAAKVFNATVVQRQRLEQALQAEKPHGPAPEFTLDDRGGHPVRLADYRGKLVFLNFWATWCGPCRDEMPSLADLARSVDPRDIVFLAVSVDDAWTPVDEFFAKGAPPFTLLLDGEKRVAERYGTEAYPESYLIGKDGELLYKFVGGRDWGAVAALKILEQAGARRIAVPGKS